MANLGDSASETLKPHEARIRSLPQVVGLSRVYQPKHRAIEKLKGLFG